MANSEAMDRMVGLFLQSALGEGVNPDTKELTPEAIERGLEATEKMMMSEEALKMGLQGSLAPQFVCLGMAMEEKPKLDWAAIQCYERALRYIGERSGNWERIVVLQQLGAVCLRNGRARDAVPWLTDCVAECHRAKGHPRDAVLLGGNFSTKQTRLEFVSTVEKLLAQTYHKLGDMKNAHEHLNEAKRLESEVTGDAVQRAVAAESISSKGSTTTNGGVGDIKTLWAEQTSDPARLKSYRFTDEGPTVLLILDLNDHLDLGDKASLLVDSLKQFRVSCEDKKVDVRLRIRHQNTKVQEFRLLLEPLVHDIVPEDTVPRLKGRPEKRRLEVKLFKREKNTTWHGDLVRAGGAAERPKQAAVAPAPKGSQLDPLTPEELAKLPRPSGQGMDNMPSSWRTVTSMAPVASNKTIEAECPAVAKLEEMD